MSALLFRKLTEWFLRLSLSAAFLSAVADRFGLWGPNGTANVAWGDWQHFAAYSGKLNWFVPSALHPILAWAATTAEIVFGVGLLIPRITRLIALGSGVLLLIFACAMIAALGIKAPLNYSVFTAAAAAFALAVLRPGQNS